MQKRTESNSFEQYKLPPSNDSKKAMLFDITGNDNISSIKRK